MTHAMLLTSWQSQLLSKPFCFFLFSYMNTYCLVIKCERAHAIDLSKQYSITAAIINIIFFTQLQLIQIGPLKTRLNSAENGHFRQCTIKKCHKNRNLKVVQRAQKQTSIAKKKPQTCIPPCWKNPTGYRILKTLSDMRYDYEGEITEALNTITLIWCYIKRNRLIYRREKGNTSLYLNIKFFVGFHL